MSEILVDNLTGKTSAGDITVTSEGGAATQSLQNGLGKIWSKTDGADASIKDSINISSTSDVGTGRFTLTYTNNMSNADYAAMFSSAWSGQDTTQVEQSAGQTSSDVDAWHFNVSNSYADADEYYYTVLGDLA